MSLAAFRLVSSRWLQTGRGDEKRMRCVVDYERGTDPFIVSWEYEDFPELLEKEHAHSLDQACFILGARVQRALQAEQARRAAA
jgi:hypothetical protein